MNSSEKTKQYADSFFSIRVAYQCPVNVQFKGVNHASEEALSNTFEDALVFENLGMFSELEGTGLIKKFQNAIVQHNNPTALGKEMFEILKTGEKAKFALDILYLQEPKKLNVPTYISEGLSWLCVQVNRKQQENLSEISLQLQQFKSN